MMRKILILIGLLTWWALPAFADCSSVCGVVQVRILPDDPINVKQGHSVTVHARVTSLDAPECGLTEYGFYTTLRRANPPFLVYGRDYETELEGACVGGADGQNIQGVIPAGATVDLPLTVAPADTLAKGSYTLSLRVTELRDERNDTTYDTNIVTVR